jgi:hypothetical protein
MHVPEDLISELFKATAEVIYDTDMQHGDGRDYWPFHPVFLDSLVAPVVFAEILRIIDRLEEDHYTLTDIGRLFKSPTKIANYQYLWPIKTLRQLTLEEKYKLARYFVQLLVILRNGNPFCWNGMNQVWSREALDKNMKTNKEHFVDVKSDPQFQYLLPKLEGLLVSYAETLYYYMIDLSRMMHGPYLPKDRTVVFVKEYFHLKAGKLWDVVSDFPFDHFKEIGIYQNMNVSVFFMGHTHSNPPFPQAIKESLVIIDDKIVANADELEKIYEKAKIVIERAVRVLSEKANDQEFLLKKGIDMFFYPLKPLYDEVSQDWRNILPDAYEFAYKVKDRIKVPGPWGDWNKEKATRHLLKLMDFWRKTT